MNRILLVLILLGCITLLVFSIQLNFSGSFYNSEKKDKMIVMPRYQNQSDSISLEEAKKLDLIYKNEN